MVLSEQESDLKVGQVKDGLKLSQVMPRYTEIRVVCLMATHSKTFDEYNFLNYHGYEHNYHKNMDIYYDFYHGAWNCAKISGNKTAQKK